MKIPEVDGIRTSYEYCHIQPRAQEVVVCILKVGPRLKNVVQAIHDSCTVLACKLHKINPSFYAGSCFSQLLEDYINMAN